MDPDLYFVLGLAIGCLSIPAMFSAFSEGRAPRGAAIMVLIGGGLMALAVSQEPTGYAMSEIPEVITRVVARYIN